MSGTITISGAEADDVAKQLDEKKIKEYYLEIVHHLLTA